MNNPKPCEYNHPSCQKIATIQHYQTSQEGVNLSSTGWTCVNCWKVVCQPEINHE